jgi:hypothetical protein
VQLPEELPLAADTRTDCYRYFDGVDFQNSSAIEGTGWLNQCQRVAELYGVTLDDFTLWNPGLGNISTAECKFDPEVRYCGKQYVGEKAPEPAGPNYELPIRVSLITLIHNYDKLDIDTNCKFA